MNTVYICFTRREQGTTFLGIKHFTSEVKLNLGPVAALIVFLIASVILYTLLVRLKGTVQRDVLPPFLFIIRICLGH